MIAMADGLNVTTSSPPPVVTVSVSPVNEPNRFTSVPASLNVGVVDEQIGRVDVDRAGRAGDDLRRPNAPRPRRRMLIEPALVGIGDADAVVTARWWC